ncbi:hypothetical protein PoB_004004400 [Plakobranchus ocellatus]|uniref:Uncharacterized protein n=1 Tax=Plakobranchus ocellatus TaxID=259542 RepID=A0AAV4B4C7_9GAST|nr:hypothetical protein PoB_004004400 [Plakobranchus ocellatus]
MKQDLECLRSVVSSIRKTVGPCSHPQGNTPTCDLHMSGSRSFLSKAGRDLYKTKDFQPHIFVTEMKKCSDRTDSPIGYDILNRSEELKVGSAKCENDLLVWL